MRGWRDQFGPGNWQRPRVQGTPSQHSLDWVQVCPYWAQVVLPGGGGGGGGGGVDPLELLLPVPGSTTPLWPQVPFVAPGGMLQGEPAQQSAVVVQAPPAVMQVSPLQTNGGDPLGLGTQGRLQQSALVAQAVPAGGGPLAAQS